jgi:hypothetical protein
VNSSAALAVLAVAATAAPALAASPFDGAWTFDPAHSKLVGDTITYEKTATGYRFSDGGALAYEFGTDGRDYPTGMSNRTVAYIATPTGSTSIYKLGGRAMTTSERSFSPDGSTMTIQSTTLQPDGTTAKETDVYQRVTPGGSGLAGQWRSIKADPPADKMIIATNGASGFSFTEPSYRLMVSGRLDGSPDTLTGPTVAHEMTASFKAVSPTEWDWSLMLGTKPFQAGRWTVSPDGRVLSQTSWVPGRESEAETAVYTKS